MAKELVLAVQREADGFDVTFLHNPDNKEGVDAASCAMISAVLRAADGYLGARRKLLEAFDVAEHALCRYYLEDGRLSDEDIDKIAEVILNDKS